MMIAMMKITVSHFNSTKNFKYKKKDTVCCPKHPKLNRFKFEILTFL